MVEPDALAADLLDGLADLPIEEVRARRAACQRLETQLSYVRRLAQGRLDIVASEVTARRDGTSGDRTLVEQLTEALSDRLTSPGNGHLPMVLAPGEVDPELLASLDRAAPPSQVTAPGSMGDDELRRVTDALATLERAVSTRRRAMFDRIDALQAEIVRRYQSGEADVNSLLGR
ncbi:MAG: hypothetical protein ABIS47_08230 [Acidimicrobiales bacterium]